MVFLMQITGMSLILSMVVLSAIGDITRFSHPGNWSATQDWDQVYMTAGKRLPGDHTKQVPDPHHTKTEQQHADQIQHNTALKYFTGFKQPG